jgi:carboxypeptidase family protein
LVIKERKMGRNLRTRFSLAGVLFLTLSSTVFGQQVLRGSIAGTVKDDTGGTLPGVSITVTSPALQVPQILRISDERGEYQVPDLPAGTYRVTYELTGFTTLVREGIVLSTGFAARVDVGLKVATLAETVTVSGETPLVDVSSTRGGTTVSKDLLAAIPGNQMYQDTLLLVGGTQGNLPPLTGEIRAGVGGMITTTYGGAGGANMIEGVRMNPNETPDFTAFEDVDVKTFGNTADVDVPGAAIQLVVKSGGNQFHGRYNELAQNHRFQSNNVDTALRAQGIKTGDAIVYYNDISGDLGGRIVRNKLWFYGAVRDLRNARTQSGYSLNAGPDGVYGTADDTPGKPPAKSLKTTLKISYQATSKHKFIGFWQANPEYEYQARGDRFTPYESNLFEIQRSREWKPVEWQGALSNQWLVNMQYSFGGYDAVYWFPDQYRTGGAWAGVPTRFNRATGYNTGPNFSGSAVRKNAPTRTQWTGSVNYIPGASILGSHALQAGYRVWLGRTRYQNPQDPPNNGGIGEYQLIYDVVAPGKNVDIFNGAPAQPVEMAVRNYPVNGESRQNEYAWYGQDSWRPVKRLTLNLGLRWERQVQYVPPQVKVQGTFGTSGSFPKVDAGAWNALAPRAGVAFDLSGDGKTVVKGTYGWFNHDLGVNGYAGNFNQNSLVIYNYRWSDPTHCSCYVPGTVNLDVNGQDFLTVTGATNNRVNPNLKLPHTHEVTSSVERELGQGLSLRGLFVYKKVINDFASVNILRPYSAYDQVFTRRDPGPDGVLGTADDGPVYTLYDYNPAYKGAAFVANMNVNRPPDRDDTFKNLEVTLTKRQTGKWFANTSFLATKNHQFLIGVVQSPNDLINSVNNTWDLSYRLAGGYNLPFGINVSTLYQAYSGLQRQRTYIFRAADPAGGPAFPSASTITLPMEPYGATRGPARNIVNLRAAKDFKFGGGRKVTMSLDAFNAFNSNVPWGSTGSGVVAGTGITDASGPTYGYVVRIVTPRVLRFSVGYEF